MVKFDKILRKERLKEILGRFKEQNILVIGDLMLDRFIYGKVERISPEAPVPVVEWQNEKSFPGGAGNVACNISSLGGRCSVVGLIGEDEPGDRLIKLLKENGVETKFIFRKRGISTTEKIRIVSKAGHQQLIRLDKEDRNPFIDATFAKDYLKEVISFLEKKKNDFSAFLFSDYGKGVINQTFLSKSLPLLTGRIVTVDPKVEHFSLYKGVTSITPNRHEAAFGLKEMVPTSQKGVEELGRKIMKALRPKSLIITQGEEGMTIFEPVRSYHISTAAKEVFDVTGAGDTVIASLTLSLSSGSSFIEAGTISTLSAGVVVGKRGVATVTPEEIL